MLPSQTLTTEDLIPQAIAYLAGLGYAVTRDEHGFWLISGPSCRGTVRSSFLVRIAQDLRGEPPC